MATHEKQPPEKPRDLKRNLKYWQERITDIPDLRLAKVLRVRRAIITNYYDEEAILNKVIRRIQNEVGVLCRKENLGTC